MAKKNKLKIVDNVAMVLSAVGTINWGLYAFGYNVVDMIFGKLGVVETGVYVLVGLSGVYLVGKWFSKKL